MMSRIISPLHIKNQALHAWLSCQKNYTFD
nr:MAG TPA: hypothetical protein [Caudoviricetes sp.]